MQLVHPVFGEVGVVGSGLPIRFSDAAAGYDAPPPRLGEHNRAVYGGLLGYGETRLAELRENGVI